MVKITFFKSENDNYIYLVPLKQTFSFIIFKLRKKIYGIKWTYFGERTQEQKKSWFAHLIVLYAQSIYPSVHNQLCERFSRDRV